MYVQVEANWSDVVGTVTAMQESSGTAGFAQVTLQLEDVKPVKGFKSLVTAGKQDSLAVLVPVELMSKLNLKPGDKLSARVRRADLKRTYVHREHVSVVQRKS